MSDTRPERWREPFGPNMHDEDVERLLRIKPFTNFNETAFPEYLSLRGILGNDTRIKTFRKGQIVVREGDYGNSAFLILNGSVRAILDKLPQNMLGRSERVKRSLLKTITQVLRASAYPESRPFSGSHNIQQQQGDVIFLQDIPRIIEENRSAVIEEGEIFGEVASLGRTPRVVTIIAEENETELLEIRWQGLRDIGRFAPEWYHHIEEKYRLHGLDSHLKATSPIDRLDDTTQKMIADSTRFLRFGGFDWHHDFKQQADQVDVADRIKSEPVVIMEGDYLNGLYLIQSGFVRMSRKYNFGEKTTSYLGKGQSFGLREICYNHEHGTTVGASFTVRAQGYVDILLIPTYLVEDYLLPALTSAEKRDLTAEMSKLGEHHRADLALSGQDAQEMAPEMVEFLLDHRTINGTATMLIDLERCTRCDDCVRACASTHDNNPRFIRQGPSINGFQITNACMHCSDPVCMLECPTGAIHRDEDGGQILINDYTCIGCSMCANACPYDNIQMITILNDDGKPQYPVVLDAEENFVAEKNWEEPFHKATKCDLCYDHLGGPACVSACPHDALIRSDMRDVPSLIQWLNR